MLESGDCGTPGRSPMNIGMPFFDRISVHVTQITRALRASPALLVTTIVTIAAATGMNLAVLGLVDRALFRPPEGLRAPESLYRVAFVHEGRDGAPLRMATTSYVTFKTIRDDVNASAGAAAWQAGSPSVMIEGKQVRADTMLVSAEYLDLLGVQPFRGRGLLKTGGGAPVVISHTFWSSAFRNDSQVLGRRIGFRGRTFEIVGVMPQGFTGHSVESVDAWFPLETVMTGSPGWDTDPFRNIVSVVVRARGAAASVAEEAGVVLGQVVELSPLAGGRIADADRTVAWWLAAVSLLVLLMGLTNAATLLTVRAARRRHESSIRLALGASRGRLLAAAAGESICVALLAVLVSLVAAWWLDEVVRRVLLPGLVPSDGTPSRVVIAAALAGVLLAAVGFGATAAQLPGSAGARELQPTRRSRVQPVLLVVQTAVSVILLAGAAMFGRTLYMLTTQDLGMAIDHLLVAEFEPGPDSVADLDELLTAALPRVRDLPGVADATVYQALPFNGFHVPPIAIPGRADVPAVGRQLPFLIAATPELHDVMGIRIVDGRGFDASDERGAPVVIVNEAMARGAWPGERAVGQCIRIGFDPDFDPATATGPPIPSAAVPCREIIGVARDVRQRSIVPSNDETALMQYYVPFTQVPMPPFVANVGPRARGLVIRVSESADASLLASSVGALLVNGRPDLPTARVRRFADIFERQLRPWRLGWALLAIFSTLAVAVSGIGLYAAFAHAVTLRRREMAIRLAVGASPWEVGASVIRDAMTLTLIGLAIGGAGAVVAGRSIGAWLYGIEPLAPLVLGATLLLMVTACMVATLLPARAAARSDPNTLLRAQ